MEVYEASHGGVVQIQRQLSQFESFEALVDEVSAATEVPPENVLLFTQDGKEVRREVLEAEWARGGEGAESSSPSIQTLYLFNKETFWQDAETSAARFMEEISLPPPLNLSAISDLSKAQTPFIMAYDHLSHLYSLFKSQSHALSIAYSNVSHHLDPLVREFRSFAARAERDLDEEENLLRSAPADLAMLPKVVIHEAFLRKDNKDKDKDNRRTSLDGEGGSMQQQQQQQPQPKTLADYVRAKKMEQVLDSCKEAHENHVLRYNELAQSMDELALSSEAERRAAEDKSVQVEAEFSEGLSRIEMALEQLGLLFDSGGNSLSQDLMELDQAMREDLVTLTNLKNEFTLDVHIHLRQVSDFQIRIQNAVEPLTTLDVDLRSKAAFPHLERLHNLPFAYAAAVVEVVRREEFANFLLEWAGRLAEVLARFSGVERDRRQKIKNDALMYMPWSVSALEKSMNPSIGVTVNAEKEPLSALNLGRADVEDLLRWVEGLKSDKDIIKAVQAGATDPIPFLEANLDTLIGKLDFASDELDKMIEQSVLLSLKKDGTDSAEEFNRSARMHALEDERDQLQRQMADLEEAHRVDVQRVKDEHEQRTTTLQNRQAELQDELVRLRSDLSDEMVARQALSSELEERAKDQEDRQREHEDQADLITALQAELSQEKDRATDLGVRLQEALIDVDGLKNVEQSLIAQLQALQEERSKNLQAVSEAQLQTRQTESEVAKFRAELEETSRQLVKAREDRDSALKNQSAEAERMMRDHIAEADGDRAVLEELNVKAKKELEDLRNSSEEKLSNAKNMAVREANGLKAELNMTKAQFRDAQRRETILADELAMMKDQATAASQKESHQSDVARDAVALASKYHEACQRLLTAINASSTISGTASTLVPRPKSPVSPKPSISSKDDLRESALGRSLANAGGFDIVGFAEAVNRVIALVKKWSKSCKHYRELSRNKITFTNFTKGDLALFLPTRNATTRPWMAYNMSTPHHFLKVPDNKQDAWRLRDNIIARIVATEEAIAGDTPDTNPFGLAEGLRFFIHQVEEYSPTAIRPPRRSASASYSIPPETNISMIASPPARVRSTTLETGMNGISPLTPATKQDSYFPSMEPVSASPEARGPSPEHVESQPTTTQQSSSRSHTPTPPDPVVADTRLSPVMETTGTTLKPINAPRTLHTRVPSRSSAASPPMHGNPIFAPSSLGRPASVASSSGSYPKGLPIPYSSTAAPAMAKTNSNDSDSPFGDFSRRVLRKTSSNASISQVIGERRPSGTEDCRPSLMGTSPGQASLGKASPPPEAFAALGTSPANANASGSGSRFLTRGFNIGGLTKMRVPSGLGTSPTSGGDQVGQAAEGGKPTAKDILKRIQKGGDR